MSKTGMKVGSGVGSGRMACAWQGLLALVLALGLLAADAAQGAELVVGNLVGGMQESELEDDLMDALQFVDDVIGEFAWEWGGWLMDAGGTALTGEQTLEVRLYDAAEGGTALWGRTAKVWAETDGAFHVSLTDAGEALDGTPADAKLQQVLRAKDSWAEVTVGGAVAGPRQRVATVPYAFMANTARKSYGDFVVDGLIWATGTAKVSAMSAEGTTIAESAKVDSLTVAGDAAVGSLAAGALDGLGTVPLGAVILWYGKASEVPDGWALCDGTTVNGIQTPDLRGRFVVGTGSNGESSYNLGDQGGAETVTLTWNQMPKHTHTYTLYDTDSRHIADFLCSSDHGFWGGKNSSQTGSAGGSGDSAGAHENLPPYQTLNYIMRVN